MKSKAVLLIAVISVILVLPMSAFDVSAQEQTNYYITVKPTIQEDFHYLSVGKNATLSFEAYWTYGANEGTPVENATVVIEVTNQKGELVQTLSVNTTTGFFSLNYLFNNPDISAFIATELVTQDGKEWNSDLLDSANNIYGLTSYRAKVYWDTFHVALVSYDTNNFGKLTATVNVTYLLLPEEGLALGSTVHLNKTAADVSVTINGVEAQEIQPGIYTASSSTWLPTAYINVKVSDDYWTTTATGFSLTQNGNQPFWIYGVVLASVLVSGAFLVRFLISKKTHNQPAGKHPNYLFYGAFTLTAASVISLYWGIVGLEGTIHTFEWFGLVLLGGLAFATGIAGSLTLTRKKYLPISISAAMVPMIVNVIVIKASLDMYLLPNPWLIIFSSLFLSVLSGFFICNIDESPQKQTPN